MGDLQIEKKLYPRSHPTVGKFWAPCQAFQLRRLAMGRGAPRELKASEFDCKNSKDRETENPLLKGAPKCHANQEPR